LRIDNEYWKRLQEDKNKLQTNRSTQDHLPRPVRPKSSRSLWTESKGVPADRETRAFQPPIISPYTNHLALPSNSILGADGRLTLAERQRHMNLGLCLRCGQTGHFARACSKQSSRPPGMINARATQINSIESSPETTKNVLAVPTSPRGPTA